MVDDLRQLLRETLARHPDGIAEHALLRALQQARPADFPDGLFRDDLALFRAHFLLFHALYGLSDALLAQGVGAIRIDPRCIRLVPAGEPGDTALADHDPMRDYYLDLGNLTDTSADDLEEMLGAFWVRYYAGSRRGEALAVLGLGPDAGLDVAQRRYRELAMTHHPDRGGDGERFRAIQEAIGILRRCGG